MPTSSPDRPSHREIRAHVERHIGVVDHVFQDTEAQESPIEVLHVAPVDSLPYHILVTAGMSDLSMAAPQDTLEAPCRLELMMTLPERWSLGHDAEDDELWGWPIRLLKRLGRYPRQHNAWLGWGDAMPNGQPPQAFAANTRLCGAILAPSLQVPVEFYELGSGPERIAFYAAIPLYREELELRHQGGMEVLLTKLLHHDIRDVVDLKRRNVARKWLGLF
jgi:hypothetical protein